jgi:hypothetical protein
MSGFSINIQEKYQILVFRHGLTILEYDYPNEFRELSTLLEEFTVTNDEILTPGGRKSPIARKFDDSLWAKGWIEKNWDIKVEVDGIKIPSPTHKVDYFKNKIAIELEWNNKDPFFDRDLNNFRLLHQLGIVSVGIIVTRADELQEIFAEVGKGKSYGASTTHISKLLPKVYGGGAAECPLIIIGITKKACIG